MSETNMITIIDENGQEKEMQILLTFEVDDGKQYALITDPNDVNEEVFPFIYDEDGHLYEVEDTVEFSMCEEVLNTFLDEE